MPTYKGSCHCGKVRFEIDAELSHVRVCDCSMCRKRGGLNFRVAESAIRVLTPLDELASYRWHTRTAIDYFCRVCGIQPFRRPRTAPHMWTVNVRCLEGVDLASLPVERVFGSQLE